MRSRDKRPCRRTAEKRNEFAPLHVVLENAPCPTNLALCDCAACGEMAHDSSHDEIRPNVRFAPKSGHSYADLMSALCQ